MKIKLITASIVIFFLITTFTSTISANLFTEKTEGFLGLSDSIPRIKGIILRSYVLGYATSGKQVGCVALIDFTNVEFKTIRLFPPGIGYVNYENVSVLMFGLKSQISNGSFYLDTKANNDKVSSIIFK